MINDHISTTGKHYGVDHTLQASKKSILPNNTKIPEEETLTL